MHLNFETLAVVRRAERCTEGESREVALDTNPMFYCPGMYESAIEMDNPSEK
jgi:hypothetical protein